MVIHECIQHYLMGACDAATMQIEIIKRLAARLDDTTAREIKTMSMSPLLRVYPMPHNGKAPQDIS